MVAGLLGWLFGKALVETRGIAMPWLIHFLFDAVIFTFLAIAAPSRYGDAAARISFHVRVPWKKVLF